MLFTSADYHLHEDAAAPGLERRGINDASVPAAAPQNWRCAAGRALCRFERCRRHPWKTAAASAIVLQTLGLAAISTYLGIQASRPPVDPSQIVRLLPVDAAVGCPVTVGQAVSFTNGGTIRRGGGTSAYRAASQIYFSADVATHAVSALGAGTLVAGFQTDYGVNYAMVGAAVDPGDKTASWQWSDLQSLGEARPDQVVALSNRSFAVVGGGFSTVGWLKPARAQGAAMEILLAPTVAYGIDGGEKPSRRDESSPRLPQAASGGGGGSGPIERTSVALLSPSLIAVSFVASAGGPNASLVTRVGTVIPGREDPFDPFPSPSPWPFVPKTAGEAEEGPAPPPAPLGAFEWPTIVWGPAASYAGVHTSHAVAALDAQTFLLCFPADDGVSASAGAALVAVAASVVQPPQQQGAARPPSDAAARTSVVVGGAAQLDGVRAHYSFDAAAVSPTRAVVVFVDGAINDGVRAVVVTLQGPRAALAVSFGATMVLNSGHGGGLAGLAGSWLHLQVVPMRDPPAALADAPLFLGDAPPLGGRGPSGADAAPRGRGTVRMARMRPADDRAAAAAVGDAGDGGRARRAQWTPDDDGGDEYYDDDDGFFDDDPSHVVAAVETTGRPFAVAYSNLANGGRVTVVFGEVTAGADLLLTSPQFAVSDPLPPPPATPPPAVQQQQQQTAEATVGAPALAAPPTAPYCWVSAAAMSASQLVVLDTRDAAAAAVALSAAAALPVRQQGARRGQRRRRQPQLRCDASLAFKGGGGGSAAEAVHACVPAAAAGGGTLQHRPATLSGQGRIAGTHRPAALSGGGLGVAWPYYPGAIANVTVVERLNRPVGIALGDAGCGAPVYVLLQGTFRYTHGVPQQPGSSSSSAASMAHRKHHMHNGTVGGGGAAVAGAVNPLPGCSGAGAAGGGSGAAAGDGGSTTALGAAGGVGAAGSSSSSSVVCSQDGPYTPGRAYFADTLGRLVEGPFAGTGGDNLRGPAAEAAYLTALSSRAALSGAASASFDGYLGVATSSWDLLVKIP